MRMAKVFYSDGSGNARPADPSISPGWYYWLDLSLPVGPFDDRGAAVAALREVGGTAPCAVCGDKRYLIAERDDGFSAVERCDACSWFGENHPLTLRDDEAAALAEADGIAALHDYPCYVIGRTAAKIPYGAR